jgi:hypothetical protein
VRSVRGPVPGMVLALAFHGPLVAGGLFRDSWDAATHIFFADHYRRSWFSLWDPRWFGGFSVSSYPPLTHQLLAVVSLPFGYDAAFGLLLLTTLVLFPVAVWRFAQLFVSPAAPCRESVPEFSLSSSSCSANSFWNSASFRPKRAS